MKFEYPANPLYHNQDQWNMIPCPKEIPEEGVKCTQVLTVDLGDLVELRFVGAENPENEFRRFMWTYHTVHLHGFNFRVQSIGHPVTDGNGNIIDINSNLKCANPSCTKHLWNETALADDVKDNIKPISKILQT